LTGIAQLPSTRTRPFILDDRILDVTIGYIGWPEIIIAIAERGHDQVLEARFREEGSLYKLTFTSDRGEVTFADLRRPVITAVRQWEAFAREAACRILAGEPEPEPGPRGPAEALRMLVYGTSRGPGTRRRGTDGERLLRDVTAAYRQLLAAGDPAPRLALAAQFGYSVDHIGRLLVKARRPRNGRPPLLGPATPGKAGEVIPESRAA
jgi:hypothetical protein